ncbi:N-acetylglucosamine-6-phosphate deacetylase [Pseudidiomarina terrestris]|uniref:N-acetylglucosamine-6-phosphate deacetylase n=1 Tax=Pseudidiomarina terrestris TaxID=2820060 RepID=UPI002650396D|nr:MULTISPECIES: N-acetylglucosamine-6-phosphate deacetylase [unclassified Pseudidiomarina]MDN7126102.1 N-acetylglucosamine-6-phosphate deacetylase [Pseudidiomarina sp. 1APR75-33.1]MDN7134130.1 N-acetylglucosamine-6-phosphate deacetylase [Pseudidiomarina sp. 1ASP75-5]MEA3588481.1 N-acetylglucosamine-6-phosphate deacetylase [Pseudidiomarina sp. 1APP75-27a]
MFVCDQVLTPQGWRQNQLIEVAAGVITAISNAPAQHNYPSYQGQLVPGFIDVQVNGGGGVLFNQHRSASALERIMAAHREHGTTALLPTLITDSYSAMHDAAAAMKAAKAEGIPGIVGVHFEGPWLSTARKGVHSEQFIRPPSADEIALLSDPALGTVMVTVAPENVSVEVIKKLSAAGIKVFLGHSDASAAQVNAALDAGAIGFTHLYNAMSPLQSRAPGMVGVCLARDCYAGLIVDGYHVDPQACQVAFRAKGKTQMMLVTDAMALAATDATEVPFFDTRIVRDGDKLTTPDGTLAGSCLTMIDAVRNTVQQCAVSLADAVEMASITPARMLGLDHMLGSIEVGKQADFMLLDSELNIVQLWQQGTPIRKDA